MRCQRDDGRISLLPLFDFANRSGGLDAIDAFVNKPIDASSFMDVLETTAAADYRARMTPSDCSK